MKNKLQVLVLYNDVSDAEQQDSSRVQSVLGLLTNVDSVEHALKKLGIRYRTSTVRSITDVPGVISAGTEQVVFNLVEELEGPFWDVNAIPAICRSLGCECTGGSTWCLNLTMNKAATKALLTEAQVCVPDGVVLFSPDDELPKELIKKTVIVKPLNLDASEGITSSSVICADEQAIRNAARLIHEKYHQPILIEHYIDGREINAAIMENNGELTVLPLSEIDFEAFPSDKPRIVCYSAKWLVDSFEYKNTPRKVPAPLTRVQEKIIRETALKAWKATDCRDYARIDMRLSPDGTVYVLEVNSNPDLSPEAGFQASLQAAGIPFESFVEKVLANAFARYQSSVVKRKEEKTTVISSEAQTIIRNSTPTDKSAILKLVADAEVFRPDEIAIAADVLESAVNTAPHKDYESLTCEVNSQVAGWLCWGPAACSIGCYEIYWLVVASQFQRMRIGRKLLEHAETLIRNRGGRIIVIETSSRSDYQAARNFYTRMGYSQVASIPDFFAMHDSKVIYLKQLISPIEEKKKQTT